MSNPTNIHEFIEAESIEFKAEPVPENPNSSGDWMKDARHFLCTFSKNEKEFQTYFSVNPGIPEQWALQLEESELFKMGLKLRSRQAFREWKQLRNKNVIAGEDAHEWFRENLLPHFRPDAGEVLDCIASDSAGVESSPLFEDWAMDYGYDEDSRKAYATFEVIARQARLLRQFLGWDGYNFIVNELERL